MNVEDEGRGTKGFLKMFAITAFIIGVLLVFAPNSLLAQGTVPGGKASKTGDPSNTILLKSRQFVGTLAGSFSRSSRCRHAIIQFDGDPQQGVLDALSDRGVTILGYIPKHAVMSYIPANTEVSSIPGIRWVGSMNSLDKVSKNIDVSLSNGFILVDVFPDVSRKEAEERINGAGGEVVDNPYLRPKTFLVFADDGVVAALAKSDAVSWIWAASDAIIAGLPVHSCPGAMSKFGAIGNYVTNGDGWDGPGQNSAHDLTYHFVNGTPDIAGDLEQAEVVRALNEWTMYAAITWTETATIGASRSMDILWGAGEHGDGYPFDGPSGVLAHCFFPAPPNPESIAGDMHLDEDETWRIGSDVELFSVALHEAGHGLGLSHSSDPNAVMYAYYQIVTGLQQDDIEGIRSIYATVGGPTCTVDSYEPDDSSVQATTILPGVAQAHSICPTGDEDWTTFTLVAPAEVVLETSGVSGDTRMWLYDSNLTLIEYNDDFMSLFSKIDRLCGNDALPAGRYYVKIDEYGDDNSIENYDLLLSVSDCPAEMSAALRVNGTQFTTGEQITIKTLVNNYTAANIIIDAELDVVLPDTSVLILTSFAGVTIPGGLTNSLHTLYDYTFSGMEPVGTYTLRFKVRRTSDQSLLSESEVDFTFAP